MKDTSSKGQFSERTVTWLKKHTYIHLKTGNCLVKWKICVATNGNRLNRYLSQKTENCLKKGQKKLHGFSPIANYTDRAIAAGQRVKEVP
jgi:hypothetical protein